MNVSRFRVWLWLVSITLLLTIPALGQSAQVGPEDRWDNGVSEPWWFDSSLSKSDIQTMKAKWSAIEQELANLHDGFAGDYFNGDETHGIYFRWAPGNGFVWLNVDKCAATVMGFSTGEVIPSRPFLILNSKITAANNNSHMHQRSTPARLALVTWRSIPYLMEENQIGPFCDYIAGLGKFNKGLMGNWELSFFTGRGTETGTADEAPIVPAGYQRFIRSAINTSIISVGRRIVRQFRVPYDTEPQYESRTQVAIDAGRLQGVKPGMKFIVLIHDADDEVLITSVAKDRSSGIIVRYVDPNPKKHFSQWPDYDRYQPIKPGWKLSTSVHKLLEQTN